MLTCFESHDEWLGHFTCSLQMSPKIEMFYFRKKKTLINKLINDKRIIEQIP